MIPITRSIIVQELFRLDCRGWKVWTSAGLCRVDNTSGERQLALTRDILRSLRGLPDGSGPDVVWDLLGQGPKDRPASVAA